MKAAYPLCSILGGPTNDSKAAMLAHEAMLLRCVKAANTAPRHHGGATSLDQVRGYIAKNPTFSLSKEAAELLLKNGISPDGGNANAAPKEWYEGEAERRAAAQAVANKALQDLASAKFYSAYIGDNGNMGMDEQAWNAQGW